MTNAVITIAIQLRSNYSILRAPASNLTQAKNECVTFLLYRSRIVFVSQSNQMHIVISITSAVVECIVISLYRSRIVVELQLWYRLTMTFISSGRLFQTREQQPTVVSLSADVVDCCLFMFRDMLLVFQ